MKSKLIVSIVAALVLVAFSVSITMAGTTMSHRKIDRSTTSAGGSTNPDSLSATQETIPVQLIPATLDDSLRIVILAVDTVKVTLQVTPKNPALADSLWYGVLVDSANADVAEVFTIPNKYMSFYGYRFKLDDVEGAATRVTLFEEFKYTRGGRGW